VYWRSAVERAVSLPARDYRTAAGLLAEAAERAGLDGELREAARAEGRALGAGRSCGDLDALAGVLAARGYEPVRDEGGDGGPVLRMRNCPFHVVAERFPPLVCGMNLALLEGLVEGVEGVRVRMDARPGWCCVVAEPSKNNKH
jgi:predicted ArsR family transcriptional regulator